jgi:hypothetical protein
LGIREEAVKKSNSNTLPTTHLFSLEVGHKEYNTVYLHVVEFENGIFVSIYEVSPRLGSISLSYPVGDNVDRYPVFTGKHGQYVDALTMLLSKKKKKLVLGSVNIAKDSSVTLDTIKQLVAMYTNQLSREDE